MNADVNDIVQNFTPEQLANLLRRRAPDFRPRQASLDNHLKEDEPFDKAVQIGVIEFPNVQTVVVGGVYVRDEITARSSKRKQYELVKRILKAGNHNAGIFAFYDDDGRFRLSLVTVTYHGTRRQFSTFRRYTFFVDPALPNKTFVQQMGRANFSTLAGILEAFSLEAVSNEFYKEFEPTFNDLANAVQGTGDTALQQDFALLFAIRIIFLGFVQKKGWLSGNLKFLQDFWYEYRQTGSKDTFYTDWLEPLFFEALSNPPGRKVAYGHAPFSKETQDALQMAPYLNGELFKRKQSVDHQRLWIPDNLIGDFFNFLFQYNFTVEENELYDEELELNPEFLGIIFERITNMNQGAVYTPRVEVDLMCRMAIVKWLEQKTKIDNKDLYFLLFREAGTGEAYDEYQKQGDFSAAEIRTLIEKLESVTVCDPAAGSGAFEVGMLQVLEQVLENLYTRNNTPDDLRAKAPTPFERKKATIANSLYGVEVKRWAVWINHLRLWLTLFVDMPDDFKHSFEPLLPNLTFKVRTGDSLVQRIGGKTFPVHGHASLPPEIKRKITLLKQKKREFFYNKSNNYRPIEQEELAVFRAILDEEIDSRREQIRNLMRPRVKQTTFLQTDPEQTELDFAKMTEEQRAALEAEIDELRAQKSSLKDERPFIWGIEFAEIFFDRGGFDIIIGNPPYVRQEKISDPNRALAPEDYKYALLEMVRLDFSDYFAQSRANTDQFKKGRKPDGRSDLYTYFYIRSLRLLNPQGVHVFICSNSWLDVGYGAWLQEFFLRQATLYLVIDNHARRSFSRADVNTVITVSGAPGKVDERHTVRFVAFKRPFEEVILSENLQAIEGSTATLRGARFRVYPTTVGELLHEGSEVGRDTSQPNGTEGSEINFGQQTYIGDKWGGKYLRAPDIFFTVLEKGAPYWQSLGRLVKGERYLNTGGADGFFIVNDFSEEEEFYWIRNSDFAGRVEKRYWRPIIRNITKGSKFIKVVNYDAICLVVEDYRPDTLSSSLKKYIAWGEKQCFHQRSVTRTQKPWFKPTVQMLHGAEIILPRSFYDSFVIHHNPNKYLSLRFYRLHPNINDTETLIANFNSTPFWLIFETLGNKNLGQGVLDFFMESFLNLRIPVVFDVKLLDKFRVLEKRQIENIFTECGIDPESDITIAEQEPNPLPDRKALDNIAFDALGLDEEERKEVYRAVCQLVWERISKAKSVRCNG